MKRSLYRLGAILLLAASMAAGAMAQQYPTRPITIVVPVPPGGGTD